MSSIALLKLKIITGSTRQNRFSEHAANWIYEIAKTQKEFTTELLDLREWQLPILDYPISPKSLKRQYGNEKIMKWSSKIDEADAFIIVTAEYNHGYPAVLKNALDLIYPEWNNKPIGFVAYGTVGGARSVEQLRQVAIELQMAPIREAVHIPQPWNLVDENNQLRPGALDSFNGAAELVLTQLLWWAKALKTARQQN